MKKFILAILAMASMTAFGDAKAPGYTPMVGQKAVMTVYFFNEKTLDITATADYGFPSKDSCVDHLKQAAGIAANVAADGDSFIIHCFAVADKIGQLKHSEPKPGVTEL